MSLPAKAGKRDSVQASYVTLNKDGKPVWEPGLRAEITSRRQHQVKRKADPDEPPISCDLKNTLKLPPEARATWLTKAIAAIPKGKAKAQEVFDIITHRKFASEVPPDLGTQMLKQVKESLVFFSEKQQLNIAKCRLVKEFKPVDPNKKRSRNRDDDDSDASSADDRGSISRRHFTEVDYRDDRSRSERRHGLDVAQEAGGSDAAGTAAERREEKYEEPEELFLSPEERARMEYIHGMDLLHSGRVQEAEVHLRASLALCPKFTNSHFGLTQALVNQRRVAEAIEAMRAGAENDPDNFMGHYNLGMMMHQTSRHAEAVVSLERALALMPSDGDVRRAAAASRQALARSGGGGGGPPRAVPAPKPSPPPPPPRPSPAPAGSSGAAAHPAGSSSSGASAGEGRVPYLSVVAASRRDDYGGKLEERVVAHVALMYHQLRERCFWDVELLYVDWNSPPERPGLAELIKDGLARGDSSSPQTSAGTCGWSSDHGPAVRIVTACGELHRALQKEGWVGPAPMPEYFAKNLGIRHARGRFVLATNPDAVLSPSLVSFLARRGLREDTFYSASLRFDDRWPQRPSRPGEYLQRLLARAGDDGRLKGTDYERTIAHRPEAHEDARKAFGGICAGEDDGAASMPGYWDFQAGDFVIAARKHWTDVWAYPEMSWTFGVDSSVLCKFFGRGLRNVALLPPCFVVHQHHRIREIPKGRGEMKEDLLCNLAKQNPRQRFDPRQREPRLWGLHGGGSGGRIGEGAVEVLEIRSGGPPGKAET